MQKAVELLLQTCSMNSYLVGLAVGDIAEKDIHFRPDNRGNSIHFIFGHLITSRYLVLQLMGNQIQYQYTDLFNMGAKISEPEIYPPFSQLQQHWDEITQLMMKELKQVNPEIINKKSMVDFGSEDKTVLGGISFLISHETYHIGQIGYIRKLLQYPTLIDEQP